MNIKIAAFTSSLEMEKYLGNFKSDKWWLFCHQKRQSENWKVKYDSFAKFLQKQPDEEEWECIIIQALSLSRKNIRRRVFSRDLSFLKQAVTPSVSSPNEPETRPFLYYSLAFLSFARLLRIISFAFPIFLFATTSYTYMSMAWYCTSWLLLPFLSGCGSREW